MSVKIFVLMLPSRTLRPCRQEGMALADVELNQARSSVG